MKHKQKNVLFLAISILLLGGLIMWKSSGENVSSGNKKNNEPVGKKIEMNEYEKENYVSVQEYTGEGFTLRNANPKTGEIAEANREKLEKAVKDFFLEDYKTEVKVHNIVSAMDGVSVFVESIGEPHFYAFAIVPVDVENEVVKTDSVWSQEGQVESAIRSGLYVMAYEEEFAKLDEFLEGIEAEYPIVGMNIEVAAKTHGNGYHTPYYFSKATFDPMYEEYSRNSEITREDLRTFLEDNGFQPFGMARVSIRFYMEESNSKPDENIYDEIYSKLEKIQGIPKGHYTLILNDNYIDRTSAIGEKENTIDKTSPNRIEKK